MTNEIFQGLKVADFTWALAGPLTTAYLAGYGATVVKIESPTGVSRSSSMFKGNVPNADRGGVFAGHSAGKYSVTLDLRHHRAKEITNKIISWADVVVENFRPGVMEKLGLDYANITRINPNVIMLSSSGYGQTGPCSRVPSTGPVMLATSGLLEITGWPDRPPTSMAGPYPDFIIAKLNITMLVGALLHRQWTGKGQYIDASQFEGDLHFLTPLILDYVVNKRIATRMGNRSSWTAPHGVYPCQGNNRWCAISITSDEEWQHFCEIMGKPELIRDPRFSSVHNRINNVEIVDDLVGQWTSRYPAEEVMKNLQARGISAGVVLNGKDLLDDPQLQFYNYYESLMHPAYNEPEDSGYVVHRRLPLRLSEAPNEIKRYPMLGEHNEWFYAKQLGIADDKFVTLINEGCI